MLEEMRELGSLFKEVSELPKYSGEAVFSSLMGLENVDLMLEVSVTNFETSFSFDGHPKNDEL